MNAQVNSSVQIPTFNGATTQLSGPTGAAAYHRVAYILPTSDFTGKIATGTTVNRLQLTLSAGAATATATNVKVYLLNTTSATYAKGTDWATIITGMTLSYSGSVSLPTTAGNVDIALSTPFTYTGGGVYVAIDADVPGTLPTTPVTLFANNLLASSLVRALGTTAPATLSTTTGFRPCLNFIFPNPTTNDMAVAIVDGIIKTPIVGGNKDVITVISNKSNATKTNVVVTLNVTGANTYTTTKTISSIAAGIDSLVTFTGFNPTAVGLNNITVSVPADQVTSNNSLPYSMYTTCADYSWSLGRTASIGALGTVSGTITNAGVWKNKFPNASTLTLYGVNVAISNDPNAIGKVLTAFAYGLNGTTTLAQSVGVTITAADTSTLKYFSFPSPVTVTTDFFVGVAQPAATVPYRPFLYSAGFGFYSYLNTAALGTADRSFSSIGIRGNLIIDPVVSPKITATSTNALCNGRTGTGLVALTPASSLYSYRWSNNATTASAALTANTYTVTATYATSCSLTATATITQPSAITVTIANSNNTATANATGGNSGYTYNWSGAVTGTTTNPTVTLTASTAVTVVVTDARGCTATQTANIVSGVENTSNSTLSVYPNPTTGKVSIGLTTANQQDAVNITVFNAVGQSVAVSANKVSANQYELDFSNLNAAVYTVRINVGSEVITRTVVLNK